MKYVVSGMVGKTKFSKEVEAKSERHASALVKAKFGADQGVNGATVKITEIKKAK